MSERRNQQLADDLFAGVREIVEENSLFLSYDDDTRYFIPPEAVDAVAWLLTAVVVPVITGAAGNYLAEQRLGRQTPNSAPPELADGATVVYRREVIETIAISKPSTSVSSEDAAGAVASLLGARGWPTDAADEDARLIVDLIARHIAGHGS